MANQLSGIAVILFIAFGSLTFILLFIFAKRQITRFALKSRCGPHVMVGVDAPKRLSLEIERRLDVIDKIRCEPWLLKQSIREQFEDPDLVAYLSPPHIYRMKAVDDVRELCKLISSTSNKRSRQVQEDVLEYFFRLYKDDTFPTITVETLNTFLLLYEQARYQPGEFLYSTYCQFRELLHIVQNDIIQSSKNLESKGAIHKSNLSQLEEAAQADESTKSLLTESFASSGGSVNKFTRETSV
ncbi:protein C1orf43 homolog isoform X1 [Stegodyphus dumicola]|uniref:protein C1orf43 homolog isoform X1 n=1 Tax=Stegodyphus dumicola TaxID=202533 RepID=UPI0015AA3365|nr:protein C1orf43 homolog isoform X1 [Stegodyphus dumicola]